MCGYRNAVLGIRKENHKEHMNEQKKKVVKGKRKFNIKRQAKALLETSLAAPQSVKLSSNWEI